jgi:hypothetical protein
LSAHPTSSGNEQDRENRSESSEVLHPFALPVDGNSHNRARGLWCMALPFFPMSTVGREPQSCNGFTVAEIPEVRVTRFM